MYDRITHPLWKLNVCFGCQDKELGDKLEAAVFDSFDWSFLVSSDVSQSSLTRYSNEILYNVRLQLYNLLRKENSELHAPDAGFQNVSK